MKKILSILFVGLMGALHAEEQTVEIEIQTPAVSKSECKKPCPESSNPESCTVDAQGKDCAKA